MKVTTRAIAEQSMGDYPTKLAWWMAGKNVKQVKLAERTGITQSNISKYAAGEKQMRLDTAKKFADALVSCLS